MKTRTRNRSQKLESQNSSNSLEIKRRKCKILPIQNKKKLFQRKGMNDSKWRNFDAELLTCLGNARQRGNGDYSLGFFEDVAVTLSAHFGTRITSKDVAGRADTLRKKFQKSPRGTFIHPVMNAADFKLQLERCFNPPTDRPISIPRSLTRGRNGTSRRSSNGCSSGSCPSVSQATMHQDAGVIPVDILVHLHAQHRQRFSGHKLAQFTKYLTDNPEMIGVFSQMEVHDQMLDFINEVCP